MCALVAPHTVRHTVGDYALAEAAGEAVPASYKRTEEGLIPEDWAVVALINISEDQAAYVHASIPPGVRR